MINRLLLIVLVAAIGWLGWTWLFPSDTAQIEAIFERIGEGLTNEGESARDGNGGAGRAGGLEGLARVASLQNEFTIDATVDAGPPFQRLVGRQAIIGAAARVRGGVPNLTVRFPEIAIDIGENRQMATALVTAEARFDDAVNGRGTDIRELEVALVRRDGEWKIAAVTVTSPLNRLDER